MNRVSEKYPIRKSIFEGFFKGVRAVLSVGKYGSYMLKCRRDLMGSESLLRQQSKSFFAFRNTPALVA